MPKLFSSLDIRDIRLKNRLAVSPMCQYTSTEGFAEDWHLVHLGSRAIGGFGLIIQEATAVSAEGRITPGDMGIWNDLHKEKLKQIVKFIHEHGSVAGIQLAHAGRKASCAKPWEGGMHLSPANGGWQTLAPSALPFYPEDNAPLAMDEKGIKKVKEDFREASIRALDVGYKIIEVHAAHGYLLHEFLSPISNNRTDAYGGSFENRIRLLLEVVDSIRSVWPENLPLFVRVSSSDYVEGGWDTDQTVKLASILKDKEVDLMDCSSGGMVPDAKVPLGPGYQVPFAERVKKESGLRSGAVGMITGARQAEDILEQGKADLILLGRAALREPYFPLNAARELGINLDWPVQYKRARL